MTVGTRPLGTSGIQVSEIGLGAWQLGATEWNGPEEEESLRIVDEAIRLGCTFIDTAPAYAGGRSEEILGRALQGRRDQVVLCTKFGHWASGEADHSASRIEESVEQSLTRLGTDYLDVLLVHSPPTETIIDGGLDGHDKVLRRLVDAGVIRAYGVSCRADTSQEIRRIVETTGSQAIEIRFNALYQEPAAAFEQAAAAGAGLIVKVPLESGWLSGRYDRSSRFDGTRSRWPAEEIARRAELVQEFESLLPEETSTAHGALRHILAEPTVATVIPGTKSVAQLRDSAAAGDDTLPAESLGAIRRLGETQDLLPW